MSSKAVATKKDKASRFTIGMITDWIEDQYQLDILFGAADLARQKDVNFLCFEGGGLDAKNEYEARRNKVYELVNAENVDGLIILSGSIANFTSMESIIKFCEQYRPLPMVLVDLKIPGIPSLSVDNGGIKELIDHLITVHGYRNFGFIKGPDSSEDGVQRYEIFLKTLAEHQVPVRQELIVQGDYSYNSGKEAISILLDHRKAVFDVVVACNDAMALGALNELHNRKVKVPGEVAVAGFDNLDVCRFSAPPLTTVGYSIYELGRRSAEILIDGLNGKEVPLVETIATRLFLRESCGCAPMLMDGIIPRNKVGTGLSQDQKIAPQMDIQKAAAAITQKVSGFLSDSGGTWFTETMEKLIQTTFLALNGPIESAFYNLWDSLLENAIRNNEDIITWHVVISELRNQIIPHLSCREQLIQAENLLQQARIIINEKTLKVEIFKYHETERLNRILSYLREQLLHTIDEQRSMGILAGTLPELGINSCYIVIFDQKEPKHSRMVLAYDKAGGWDQESGRIISVDSLLSGEILSHKRRTGMLAVSLSINEPQLGLALFEIGPREGKIYGELRRIIHGSLQASILFNQIKTQATHLMIQKEFLRKNFIQSKKVMTGFIEAIALMVETRDLYTAGHQQRVADLACAIAVEMKLGPNQIEAIQMAGMVHDLGKLYIPSEILNKPGRLSELEFNFMKTHSEIAYNILKNIDFDWPIAQIILQHHEKMDGSGYPNGLKGRDIQLEARILTVADVVEAMTSHRPYRPAFQLEDALTEISEKRGLLYDSIVVDHCVKLFRFKGFHFKSGFRS